MLTIKPTTPAKRNRLQAIITVVVASLILSAPDLIRIGVSDHLLTFGRLVLTEKLNLKAGIVISVMQLIAAVILVAIVAHVIYHDTDSGAVVALGAFIALWTTNIMVFLWADSLLYETGRIFVVLAVLDALYALGELFAVGYFVHLAGPSSDTQE